MVGVLVTMETFTTPRLQPITIMARWVLHPVRLSTKTITTGVSYAEQRPSAETYLIGTCDIRISVYVRMLNTIRAMCSVCGLYIIVNTLLELTMSRRCYIRTSRARAS